MWYGYSSYRKRLVWFSKAIGDSYLYAKGRKYFIIKQFKHKTFPTYRAILPPTVLSTYCITLSFFTQSFLRIVLLLTTLWGTNVLEWLPLHQSSLSGKEQMLYATYSMAFKVPITSKQFYMSQYITFQGRHFHRCYISEKYIHTVSGTEQEIRENCLMTMTCSGHLQGLVVFRKHCGEVSLKGFQATFLGWLTSLVVTSMATWLITGWMKMQFENNVFG